MERDRPWRLLFTWTRWLRLRHPNLVRVNLIATPAVGGLACAMMLVLPGGLNFAGDRGVAHQVNGLLQILAPFFVAALAAISTFQRTSLDAPMGGQPPLLVIDDHERSPSQREFFGYLFGYLAALSIILYAVGAIFLVAGSSSAALAKAVGEFRYSWAAFAIKAIYLFALANLSVTTFVGLHYLLTYLPSPAAQRERTTPPVAPSSTFIPDRASQAAPPPEPPLPRHA